MAVVFEELWPGSDGASWDSGRWPSTAAGSGSTIDIQSARGRMLCEQPPERPLVWALADHDAVTDFDLLLDWTPANTDDFRLGIIFGCTSTTAGNMLYIRPFSGTNGQIRLYNGVDLTVNINGNASVLEISDGTEITSEAVTFTNPSSNRYSCRVQRDGNTVRCRVWPHSQSEPGTWHVEETLTTNPSGVIGLMAMAHSTGEEPDIRWGPITLDDGQAEEPAEGTATIGLGGLSLTASGVVTPGDPAVPAVVPGTDTSDLTAPVDRAGKGQRWQWWTGARWDAVLPTASGWRLYTDLLDGMTAGPVVDNRQAARVDTVFHDGTLWVARGHTSAPRISRYLLDGGSYTADETDVALPAGLAAANGDASPLVLFRSTNGRLWVACNNGANVVVAVSDDDGDTWDDETVLSVSETGVAMLAQTGDTIVLLSTLNDGGGRAVRTIDQDAADISSGEWATEALPSLPGGISSDDHGMAVSVGGHIYATSKTEGSESSGTPLLYLLDRTPAGSWSATTLRPGPDDGDTRPHLVGTGSTLYVAYGRHQSPTDANLLAIPRDTLTVPSPVTLLDEGEHADSAIPPRHVSGESGLLWLVHERDSETIWRVWQPLPHEGAATIDLGGLVLAGTGRRTVHGSVSLELGGVDVTATGEVSAGVEGTADLTLGGLDLSAAGQRITRGAADVALGGLDLSAAGKRTVHGSATVTLGGVDVTADGTRITAGAATLTLGGLDLAADGEVTGETTGTATLTLGGLDLAASGHVTVHGTATLTLGGLGLHAVAEGARTGIDLAVTIGPMRRQAPTVGGMRDEPPATVAAVRDAALARAETLTDATAARADGDLTDATAARATGQARRGWAVATPRRGWQIGPIRRDR